MGFCLVTPSRGRQSRQFVRRSESAIAACVNEPTLSEALRILPLGTGIQGPEVWFTLSFPPDERDDTIHSYAEDQAAGRVAM